MVDASAKKIPEQGVETSAATSVDNLRGDVASESANHILFLFGLPWRKTLVFTPKCGALSAETTPCGCFCAWAFACSKLSLQTQYLHLLHSQLVVLLCKYLDPFCDVLGFSGVDIAVVCHSLESLAEVLGCVWCEIV